VPGISTMHIPESTPQSIFVTRNKDDMNMVRHQAIRHNLHIRLGRRFRQRSKVKFIIAVFKKRLPTPVTALNDVMGYARQDEMGKASRGLLLTE